MIQQIPIITIDGPGGSGKGTLSLLLVSRLQWHFLDSGALYRALAVAALHADIAMDNEVELSNLAENLQLSFHSNHPNKPARIFIKDNDVTDQVRTPETGGLASKIAVFQQVRTALLERQRAFAKAPGLIADGRDMGTVVFPEAELKFFLEASAEERAQRRFNQLKEKGIHVNLAGLLSEIKERDRRDRERTVAPLKPADDAIIIDTTQLAIDDVLQQVWDEVVKRFPSSVNTTTTS